MTNSEDYEWEPIPGWVGRYRCAKTQALGYRGIVNQYAGTEGRRPGDIYPYKCKTCGCPASRKQKSNFYCTDHGKLR